MTHLLVTNDFPPKIGGIQSYLWELWRRLDPESFEVLTTAHPEAAAFDAGEPYRIHRLDETQFLPTRSMASAIRERARAAGADMVVLDPALPLGLLGPRLGLPYLTVLHGAEVTVPGRLPVSGQALGYVLRHARHVVAAGGYPAREAARAAGAGRMPPVTIVAPGVDPERFRALDLAQRHRIRASFGVEPEAPVVLSVSRLVPRKGMDVLIEAAARLAPEFPGLQVLISGEGRDRRRLEKKIRSHTAPVRLLGAVANEDLPGLYGAADVFAMLCRNRWGGLEQEGFGIVFLEAAACGVPQVAGNSGGAAEAVVDGETGSVLSHPRSVAGAVRALRPLLADAGLRRRMGEAGRRRVLSELSYDVLAARLAQALSEAGA